MMTYEQYQKHILDNEMAMRESKMKEKLERARLEEERQLKTQEAFKSYCDQRHNLMEHYSNRIQQIHDRYAHERSQLHLIHARIVEQWREEHGINTPPFVELPSDGQPNDGGTE